MLVKHMIIWAAMCCFFPAAGMAEVFSVSVDHTTISRDHIFQLVARLKGSSDDFVLDVTPLTKNFYVTAERDTKRAGLWREKHYRLGAKRTGILNVPALVVMLRGKKLSSQPFQVKVLDTSAAVDDVHLWLVDKVSRKQVWLRQQLLWQATVLSTYPFAGAPDMHLPLFKGFDVQKVDVAVPGEKLMDGRRLFSISWRVLLFPLQTGKLAIARPVVSARLLQIVKTHRFAAGNPNFGAGDRRIYTKKAMGKKQAILVRALPLAAAHLPVGHLALTANIPDKHAYVAAPLTWNIQLTGKQIRRSDMPDLRKRLLLNGPFTVAREKPLVSVRKDGYQMSVSALYRVVLTPSKQGQLRLPGMDVAFFNPDSGRIEHTSIAPRLLTVLPQRKSVQSEGFEIDGEKTARHLGARMNNVVLSGWKMLAIGMFALWLCTLAAWFFSSRRRLAAGHVFSRRSRRRSVMPSLRRALAARDAEVQFAAIKDALGLPESMTPLGLLAYAPALSAGESGAWLDALERTRWQGASKPQTLNNTCVRNMTQIIRTSVQNEVSTTSQVCNAAAFGRIGG